MTRLFSVDEILAATGGRARGVAPGPIKAISIDSREIPPGALFVAIKGDRFDGHDFVASALANGAVAALVSESRAEGIEGPLIIVPDALEGLADIADAARERSRAAIVAVTGSAGKTTTKEAIRTVLSAAGETHASIQSFNNHWGVPLMLARMPASAQFGVFELGMNHPGEITPLTQMVRPHVAVITTVAAAHLEFFDSVADIARAKAEIFSGLEPGGTVILNADHEHAALLVEEARRAEPEHIVTYGFGESADWRIEGFETFGEKSMAQVMHAGNRHGLMLQVQGRHMVANAVAALAVAHSLGVDPAVAATALAGFGAPEGRGLTIRLGDRERPLLLVDESYNANVASMAAAMEVFAPQKPAGGSKVLVLGDMLELGEQGPALHRALRDSVLATGAERIYLVGTSMAALAEALGDGRTVSHAASIEEIEDRILNGLAYGDAVMVKGSKGVRLAGLVKKIRAKFQ